MSAPFRLRHWSRFLVVFPLYISSRNRNEEEVRQVAQVHIYLDRTAGGERSNAHAESVQFLLAAYGVVFWEGGVGQEAVIWPWHRVKHAVMDRGAEEILDRDRPWTGW